MACHLNRLFDCIPIQQVSQWPQWHDSRTKKSVLILKLVWILFVTASVYLMVDQIYDSTSIYLNENKVTSHSLSTVPKDNPIWVCIIYLFDLSNSNHRHLVNFLSTTDLHYHNRSTLVSRKLMNENQIKIVSAKEYIATLRKMNLYAPSKSIQITDIRSSCFDVSGQIHIFCVQCIRLTPETAHGNRTVSYVLLPANQILHVYKFPELIIDQGRSGIDYATGIAQSFQVRIYQVKYEVAQDHEQCKPIASGEIFYDNCIAKCMRHQFGRENGCTPFSASELYHETIISDLDLCTIRHVETGYNAVDFNGRNEPACALECQTLNNCHNPRWEFTGTTSYREAKMETGIFSQNNVLIFLDYGIQQNVKQLLAKSMADYLADLGGIIGLYFGFSMIGLVHLMFYCIFIYLRSRGRRKLSNVTQKISNQHRKVTVLAKLRSETLRANQTHVDDTCATTVCPTDVAKHNAEETTRLITEILVNLL